MDDQRRGCDALQVLPGGTLRVIVPRALKPVACRDMTLIEFKNRAHTAEPRSARPERPAPIFTMLEYYPLSSLE